MNVDSGDCYFWATHNNAELDLLIVKHDKKYGYEFKYTDTPKVTASIQIAINDLKLESLTVLIPGKYQFSLTAKVKVMGLDNIIKS